MKTQGYEKPTSLYHLIGGNYGADPEMVENIKAKGLQSDFGGWENINELLPNRPRGIFFWGPEMAGEPLYNRIEVAVADLDTSKLWAFRADFAEAANLAICGYELVEGAKEIMAEAQATPFDEYDGSFAAEYIYTEDVPANIIK